MDAIAAIPDNTHKDARPLMYVRGKNKGGVNRPTPHDTARQAALKLLENGEITHRDGKMMMTLLGIGIATRHQLQRLFWQEAVCLRTALVRLRLLEKKGILRASRQYLPHLAQMGLIACNTYGLGDVGLEVLAWRNALDSAKAVPYNSSYYSLLQGNHLFTHHIQTSELYTRLKLAARQQGHPLQWLNETVASVRDQNGAECVRPDGGILLQGEEGVEPFFVEIDTRNTDWHKKVIAYERAFREGLWQERFGSGEYPPVLCVVPNAHSVTRIARLIRDTRGMSSVVYLFKAWPDLLAGNVYEKWYQASSGRLVNLLEHTH